MAKLYIIGLAIAFLIVLGTLGAMAMGSGFSSELMDGRHSFMGRGGCDSYNANANTEYEGSCYGPRNTECNGTHSEDCENDCEYKNTQTGLCSGENAGCQGGRGCYK